MSKRIRIYTVMLLLMFQLLQPVLFSQSGQANADGYTSALVPVLLSAEIPSGHKIVLTYNVSISSASVPTGSSFFVSANRSLNKVTAVQVSDRTVSLTVENEIVYGQTVTLSYASSEQNKLTDISGNKIPAFVGKEIPTTRKLLLPQPVKAVVNGSTVSIEFSGKLNKLSTYAYTQFSVSMENSPVGVKSALSVDHFVILTLSAPVAAGQNTTVSYLGGSYVQDTSGSAIQAFSGLPVQNGTSSTSVPADDGGTGGENGAGGTAASGSTTIIGASVRGNSLIMTFSQPLDPRMVPSSGQFNVMVQGDLRSVISVAVSGSAVTLELYQQTVVGDLVKVGYRTTSSVNMQNSKGEVVAGFPDYPVNNQNALSVAGSNPNVLGGGINLVIQSAVTSPDLTPGGKSTNRYTLAKENVAAAFNSIRLGNAASPRVVFIVPPSEAAAIVAVPVLPLEEAQRLNDKSAFAVAYRDMTYEIPLAALDYSAFGEVTLAGKDDGYMLIEIDTEDTGLTAPLSKAIRKNKAKLLSNLMHTEVSMISGSISMPINQFQKYTTRTVKVPAKLDPGSTAVVWLDPATGQLSYVPTRVEQDGNESVVLFRRQGNSAYAVIRDAIAYSDIDDHWARNDILLMVNKYIADGRTNRDFQPEEAVTRGEFASYIAKGLGLTGDKAAGVRYKDVSRSSAMAAYIGAASKAGIIEGYADGTFKPNSPITREQIAAITVRAAKTAESAIVLTQSKTYYLQKFKDRNQISSWADEYIAEAVQAGIIKGITPAAFSPKSKATRAQAIVLIERLLTFVKFLDV